MWVLRRVDCTPHAHQAPPPPPPARQSPGLAPLPPQTRAVECAKLRIEEVVLGGREGRRQGGGRGAYGMSSPPPSAGGVGGGWGVGEGPTPEIPLKSGSKNRANQYYFQRRHRVESGRQTVARCLGCHLRRIPCCGAAPPLPIYPARATRSVPWSRDVLALWQVCSGPAASQPGRHFGRGGPHGAAGSGAHWGGGESSSSATGRAGTLPVDGAAVGMLTESKCPPAHSVRFEDALAKTVRACPCSWPSPAPHAQRRPADQAGSRRNFAFLRQPRCGAGDAAGAAARGRRFALVPAGGPVLPAVPGGTRAVAVRPGRIPGAGGDGRGRRLARGAVRCARAQPQESQGSGRRDRSGGTRDATHEGLGA